MRLSKDTKEHEMQSRLTAMYTKIAESHSQFNDAMKEYAGLLYEREHQSRVEVRKRAAIQEAEAKEADAKRLKRVRLSADELAEIKKNTQEYMDECRAEDKKRIAAGALIIIN